MTTKIQTNDIEARVAEASKRYMKFVEWSDEDRCFIGRCPSLMAGGVHGDNEAAVYKELGEAVTEVLTMILTDGEKLPDEKFAGHSGQFVVRIDPRLHGLIAAKAFAEGQSLNEYVVKRLTTNENAAAYLILDELPFESKKPTIEGKVLMVRKVISSDAVIQVHAGALFDKIPIFHGGEGFHVVRHGGSEHAKRGIEKESLKGKGKFLASKKLHAK